MILLITYDLRNPSHNYEPLYNEIKQAEEWWHYIDSAWLIKTQISPQNWYSKIAKHFFLTSDSFLIIEVKRNYYGWLPQDAWEWIDKRLV